MKMRAGFSALSNTYLDFRRKRLSVSYFPSPAPSLVRIRQCLVCIEDVHTKVCPSGNPKPSDFSAGGNLLYHRFAKCGWGVCRYETAQSAQDSKVADRNRHRFQVYSCIYHHPDLLSLSPSYSPGIFLY